MQRDSASCGTKPAPMRTPVALSQAIRTLIQGFALAFLLVSSASIWAQNTVVGFVKDGETGEPMFSASVTVDGTTQGVMTDFDGRFSGIPTAVYVPISAVMVVYARENGQGMVFDAEGNIPEPPTPGPDSGPPGSEEGGKPSPTGKPSLRLVK